MLEDVERRAIAYFDHEVNPATGLVRDNTDRESPASVAGTGFALSAYAAAVERGYMARRTTLNVQMGMGHERDDDARFPGTTNHVYAETAARGFYRRWAELLATP